VRLHYALQSTEKLYLVMQYCPGGDLLRHIKKKGRLDENATKKYVTEVILALEELHKA
jgi:serine/threonine protein kinase